MSCEGFEIAWIGGEDSAARFSMRHHERVDRRTAFSASPEKGCTSGERLG
jgi:hypothetical protein